MVSPESCPHCGADLPPNAKICPECGSDESTGWSERAVADRLDLPDPEFDYDDFVQREFGKKPSRPRGVSVFWWSVAVVLILLLIFWWVL